MPYQDSIGLNRQAVVVRTLLTDVVVLVTFYLTVNFAHILPFALYQLDPMKIFILLTVAYSSRGNALLMALALPLLSFLSTGHPVAPKFLLIGAELMIFVWVMGIGSGVKYEKWLSFLGAVVVSKVAYYSLKAGIIGLGWLNQELFSTGLFSQLIALGVLSLVFLLITAIKNQTASSFDGRGVPTQR